MKVNIEIFVLMNFVQKNSPKLKFCDVFKNREHFKFLRSEENFLRVAVGRIEKILRSEHFSVILLLAEVI